MFFVFVIGAWSILRVEVGGRLFGFCYFIVIFGFSGFFFSIARLCMWY